MNFAEKLKLIRTTKGLTQSDFAKTIGVSRANIANLELNNVKPTQMFINCVSLTHNVDKDWLINDDDNSLDGLKSYNDLTKLIADKYEQLDNEYKIFIEKQIQELLKIQEKHNQQES
ncbi:TPA: helix-turn-helix transcriptional regulator [Clostridioides difficile]|uniref:helix-turn-helix domain-containing protein n=1 Tax=Clostridioides difficile TaxID=1496 RepID=UPI00038CD729|nr:helix-turn-helix transcriptional regulator [Clostridioides difficile]AXU54389.1 putative prophage repressor [Clostridioides difficile]EGT3735779.1 XRE family transcriptional regulator [Clostridioides difficile]EGT3788318.1 XRE family transcriptional regulator [Clostridioides difficile]EGT4734450.1 XRE family transcriptional regulator [Clostridioides difficile]EGT4842078.1 XRE family transcriptional regulator [Clostridioides difficile]